MFLSFKAIKKTKSGKISLKKIKIFHLKQVEKELKK
jgi:hypothetical protein